MICQNQHMLHRLYYSNFTLFSTVCGFCKTNPVASKSESGDPAQEGEGAETGQARKNRAINKATLKLDWVLGDDPSHIVIPGSPPAVDAPVFFAAGDSVETGHVVLETIAEKEETAPARVTPRNSRVATWPRVRQILNDRHPIADFTNYSSSDFSGSTSNGLDSGVSKSASVETGLSTVTTDSSLPKISEKATTNVDKGTQTDCNMVDVHVSPQEGRLGNITHVHQYTLCLLYLWYFSPHVGVFILNLTTMLQGGTMA